MAEGPLTVKADELMALHVRFTKSEIVTRWNFGRIAYARWIRFEHRQRMIARWGQLPKNRRVKRGGKRLL